MARQATHGGYDYKWTEEPPDELKCLICLCVARDPRQHPGDSRNECGRVFCDSCIGEYLKSRQHCPNCRRTLTLFRDSRGARQIRTLKVKCNNTGQGCRWTGELGSVETHLQTCGYLFVPCPNQCKDDSNRVVEVLKKDLGVHLTKCPKRYYCTVM